MSQSIKPSTTNHNHMCESATLPGCRCECDGIVHQRDILVAAFESRGTAAAFDAQLTRLFGSAFTTLSADPGPGEQPRRAWEPIASAASGKRASQVEQRVVDVSVRDILKAVHAFTPARKHGWLEFLDGITLHSSWRSVVNRIEQIAGPHDDRSGYFWSGVLAASNAVLSSGSPLTAAAAAAFLSSTSTDFRKARHPRARSGIRVQLIQEMSHASAVDIGIGEVAHSWAMSALSSTDKLAILCFVGSVLSADLWRHPAAVRHLLLPAVGHLRALSPGIRFSLDLPSKRLEKVIDEELGEQWRSGGAW